MSVAALWTHLCREPGKGLESRGAVGWDQPLADHVSCLDPGDGRGGRMERLEARHRARDPLDEAVILLKNVVQVFDLPDLNCVASAGGFQDRIDRLQTSQIGTALVDDHPIRQAVRADHPLEKPPRSRKIAAAGLMKIKDLAIPIHGTVEVGPEAFHLDVGLIHSPGIGRWPLPGLSRSAMSSANFTTHRFSVAWPTVTPRSAKISSRPRYETA